MKLKTDNIFQITEIQAKRSEVYRALTDDREFFSITGLHATFISELGSRLKSEDGKVQGYFLAKEQDEFVVMAYRHANFFRGIHTIIHIELTDMEDGGTRLHFNQIGVPEEHAGWLTEHWRKDVWTPFMAHFATLKTMTQ
jgi:uncharacterized protein YndB with AHSA1/START domain